MHIQDQAMLEIDKTGKRTKKKGFTLIEILLVIAAISILASIVIVAINPARQLGQARDAKRKADVNTILNASWQYAIDNNGTLPATITSTQTDIWTGAGAVGSFIDLSVLVPTYVVNIPSDPSTATSTDTKYAIRSITGGRVLVAAISGEQATTAIAAQSAAGATTVTVSNGGSGYTSIPPVTITNGTCTGTGVGIATVVSGAVSTITTTGLTCSAGQTFTVAVTPPIFVSR